ncbi:MAG: hypothetical protein NWE89_02675 [Candidatus Bathyarchaeota archaeon]|nr:hypothetical protein [Candidatus Bathyarchaeota archaeon]
MGGISDRKGISPVIASVILVAVAITIAVSASFWMSGITNQYTHFEKIGISSGYCINTPSVGNAGWEIVLTVKNSGSAGAAFEYAFVNKVPIDEYNIPVNGSLSSTTVTGTSIPDSGFSLASGEGTTIYVWIGSDLFSSGTSIVVMIHSLSGTDYMRLIRLT